MRKKMTTTKNGPKKILDGEADDNLRVKEPSVGGKNKLLKAELAFLSITVLATDTHTSIASI